MNVQSNDRNRGSHDRSRQRRSGKCSSHRNVNGTPLGPTSISFSMRRRRLHQNREARRPRTSIRFSTCRTRLHQNREVRRPRKVHRKGHRGRRTCRTSASKKISPAKNPNNKDEWRYEESGKEGKKGRKGRKGREGRKGNERKEREVRRISQRLPEEAGARLSACLIISFDWSYEHPASRTSRFRQSLADTPDLNWSMAI